MKKLFIGLLATMFAAAALVGFTNSAATAGPYTGTVKTSTKCMASNVKQFTRGRIAVKVNAINSNTAPKGKVTIRVVKNAGPFRYVNTKTYSGGQIVFRTPVLKKTGKYTVFCRFDRKFNSIWRDSNQTDSFRVTRRR